MSGADVADAAAANHYDTLGLKHDASTDDVKRAYRRLAMEHHPDKGGTASKFNEINEAYAVLSDAAKRSEYDMIKAMLVGIPGRAFVDLQSRAFVDLQDVDDIMREVTEIMFTHVCHEEAEAAGTTSASAPKDAQSFEVGVSLDDLMHGVKKRVQYDIDDACTHCRFKSRDVVRCTNCRGRGFCTYNLFLSTQCPTCDGQGVCATADASACVHCDGAGTITTTKHTSLHIPKGVRNGHRFVLKGKGSYDVDTCCFRDIIVVIRHDLPTGSVFNDSEAALHVDVEVSLVELVCGFDRELYGLATLASRGFVDPNKAIVLSGKGLPKYGSASGGERGNLVLHLKVVYPAAKTMARLAPIFAKLFKETALPEVPEGAIQL